jgi:hypothetical protein
VEFRRRQRWITAESKRRTKSRFDYVFRQALAQIEGRETGAGFFPIRRLDSSQRVLQPGCAPKGKGTAPI